MILWLIKIFEEFVMKFLSQSEFSEHSSVHRRSVQTIIAATDSGDYWITIQMSPILYCSVVSKLKVSGRSIPPKTFV